MKQGCEQEQEESVGHENCRNDGPRDDARRKAEVAKMQNAMGAPTDDATAADIVTHLAENYAAPQ